MAGFRKPEVPRDQLVLWSARLDDAIPTDHPVRHVAYLLDSEPFSTTFREWEQSYVLLEGKPPYHPRDLTGLYVYGMMNRVRSSRQLEAACYNRVDVIWLMSGQHPDHSTIAEFVNRHRVPLRALLRNTLEVGLRAGLVKLEHVGVDGSKFEADAGKGSVHKKVTIEVMLAQMDEQIGLLEKEWLENETREGRLFGNEVPWVPGELGSTAERLRRLKRTQQKLKDALAQIDRRRAECGSECKEVASVTDPDGRSMKDKEGKSKPNYNTQIGVDQTCSLITAAEVNDHPDDSGLLTMMLEQTKENCGHLPSEASADSQYNTGPELAMLEGLGVKGFLPDNGQPSTCPDVDTPAAQALAAIQGGATLRDEQWVALPKDGKGRITKEAFRYDAQRDVYVCPMDQVLPFLRYSRDRKNWGEAVRAQYGGCPGCATCPQANICCSNPNQGRTINRDQYESHRERMRERMKSDEGRSRYRLRREIVEPRFGHIKHGLGIRRFMHRGIEKVRTEWSVICAVVNIGVLIKHWPEVVKVLQ
jgi:transposase